MVSSASAIARHSLFDCATLLAHDPRRDRAARSYTLRSFPYRLTIEMVEEAGLPAITVGLRHVGRGGGGGGEGVHTPALTRPHPDIGTRSRQGEWRPRQTLVICSQGPKRNAQTRRLRASCSDVFGDELIVLRKEVMMSGLATLRTSRFEFAIISSSIETHCRQANARDCNGVGTDHRPVR